MDNVIIGDMTTALPHWHQLAKARSNRCGQ